MKKSILTILVLLVLTTSAFAVTHVITIDSKASDDSTETVATIQRALELAKKLNPSEELPVLIKLGQGEFAAPDTEWEIKSKWIFFAGNGPENTKIVADKIGLCPEAITSFKDICLDTIFDIGDSFVPVDNVKVFQLEKKDGQLDGVWQNAVGEIQVSDKSVMDLSKIGTNAIEKSSSIFPNDGNNIILSEDDYVLKAGSK